MPLGRSWTPGTSRNTSSTRFAPVRAISDSSRKCPWRLFRRRSNPMVARYVEPATLIGASTCTVSPSVISTRRAPPQEEIRPPEGTPVELQREHRRGTLVQVAAEEDGDVGRHVAEHRPAGAV